ncbi:MAG: hypothetical protein ACJ74Z_12935 [Bryobacteraceae bacterium]
MPRQSTKRTQNPGQHSRQAKNAHVNLEDLKTKVLALNGRVFTDPERAKVRLESVNTLLTQVFTSCIDLKELTDNSTAIETFEAVANALHGVQDALLLFYRRALDVPHGNAAKGAWT